MSLWYLLDTTHPDYVATLMQMQVDHESRGVELFSNPISPDDMESFAKVQEAQEGDYTSGCIIAVYDATTHPTSPPAARTGRWTDPDQGLRP